MYHKKKITSVCSPQKIHTILLHLNIFIKSFFFTYYCSTKSQFGIGVKSNYVLQKINYLTIRSHTEILLTIYLQN